MTKAVVIDAPFQKVFHTLDDPNALPFLYYCICNVSDVTWGEKRVGDTFRGSFSVIGVHFEVIFTCTEHAPPLKIVERLEGGMEGSMVFVLEPRSGATNVILQVDYETSRDLLGKISDRLLFEQVAEKNAERILENLKIIVEVR